MFHCFRKQWYRLAARGIDYFCKKRMYITFENDLKLQMDGRMAVFEFLRLR